MASETTMTAKERADHWRNVVRNTEMMSCGGSLYEWEACPFCHETDNATGVGEYKPLEHADDCAWVLAGGTP